MFDGSVNVPRGAFDRYCEQAGGYNNAYTNEDKTNYYMVLPSSHLELGLWLESDRLLGLNLTPEGLETQKSVVMEEKLQRVDNQPYGALEDRLAANAFAVHPYSHSVIGSMEDIASATYEDVVRFHETYYVPNNAVLVVAGDVDPEETLRLVEKYFGSIPAGRTVPRIMTAEPQRLHESREVIEDDIVLPAVFMAYNVPGEGDPDHTALDMLADFFGYGESSRFHRSLVYEQQLAVQAGAYMESREHPGLLVFYAFGRVGRLCAELESAVEMEIERALTGGMADRELLRVRNKIETLYYHGLESVVRRAERLSHDTLLFDDPHRSPRLLGEYLSTTETQIIDAGRRYLAGTNRTVLHFVPRPAASGSEVSDETVSTVEE